MVVCAWNSSNTEISIGFFVFIGHLGTVLLRTSPRPLPEGPSSEDITSVWSLPHTHPLPNHGLYLCLPVFPVRPILWECLVGHPGVQPTFSSANGEDDKIQDFPGIPALVPSDLQLHSLQSPLGQS
ncbi:hypothetical protein CB1_000552039 [Camelus ferus]|nr:hypothetical protein CB1_000552039 [Camelus ferus]